MVADTERRYAQFGEAIAPYPINPFREPVDVGGNLRRDCRI